MPGPSAPGGFEPDGAAADVSPGGGSADEEADEEDDAVGVETSARERSEVSGLCASSVSRVAVPPDVVGASTGFAEPEAPGLAVAEGAFFGR